MCILTKPCRAERVGDAEKIARINFWFQWFMDRTETFDWVGPELAYFLGAVAGDTFCAFDPDNSMLLALLKLHRDDLPAERYAEITSYIETDFAGGYDSPTRELPN